jgi:hypothetical protein
MANVRPPRKSQFTRVDNDNEEPELINPKREKTTANSFFFDDYNQMHSETFKAATGEPVKQPLQSKGISGGNLESLVRTLASLQFTTKGKVDADGKVEIVFCSPVPIVTEEKPKPEVRFIESERPRERTRHRSHKQKEHKRLFLM